MLTKLETQLVKNEACFKRYVASLHFYFEFELEKYNYSELHDKDEYERHCNNLMLVSLGREFYGLLTEGEKAATDYLGYHKNHEKEPDNYIENRNSAYEKWIKVFFKNKNIENTVLDPFVVGGIMKYIRKTHKVTKTHLALCMGVDRNTVALIEKGERLPSLNYTYKFSKMFEISIEELIDYHRFLAKHFSPLVENRIHIKR